MPGKDVEQYNGALELRAGVVAHLAIFAGIRPGEILGLKRQHGSSDCLVVTIAQRLYRGDIDTPKTRSSKRTVAIPTKTAPLMQEWMGVVGISPAVWVFFSENANKPMWRDNIWYRGMKPKLQPSDWIGRTFRR